MKSSVSFRTLVIILFVGGLVPLLVVTGLAVYRLQQAILIDLAQSHLVDFVQAGVQQYVSGPDLTVMAVSLAEDLRVLGADMFIQDAGGNPVPPSLGTGPWLDAAEHQAARQTLQSSMRTVGNGSTARIVYLSAIVDPSGAVLGSVEASLPMASITEQLNALRLLLTLVISLASGMAVVFAVLLSWVITRPIKTLVESVEHVRRGNLDKRAPVSEVYELGRLASTHNQMLDRISDDLTKQARLADAMRQFAADASHELRSPLSVFRNSVELLERAVQQDDNERLPYLLSILRKEVDSMAALVENLLLLARLEQSEEAVESILRPEEIHPFPLLEEIYERSHLMAKGQQIELIWPMGEISPICADPAMVRHAINNVIENAIFHTEAGKKIRLSVESQEGYCCFIIEDQGQGIPPDQLSRIFERFYRGDESRNRKIPGSGLGLAIVDAIVRAHKGEIRVDSEPGRGTRFRLFFKQMPPHSS